MPSTKKSVCLFASGLLLLLSSIYSFGQTSSFTYQGKLNDGGGLANAQYDFVFRLFDPSGTQVGSDLARDDIQVTAGIFTVTLDFGSSPFLGGAADTLEIGVRPGASAGSYTILAPRQPLTSSPYAIKSSSASTADTSTNAFQLGGVVANQYVVTNDARMTDARVPTPGSGDYVQNTTSPQSTSNFNISGTGNANIFNANTQYNLGLARVLSNAGTNNLFVGQVAGNGNTTGITNTFVGSQAGQLNISGSRNSFFGARAGLFNSTDGNSFFGAEAGGNTTTGGANSFFGNSAGSQNQTGFANSFFGAQAGELTTGIRNVSVGTLAGVNNTSGGQNTFIGAAAGESNVTGGSNSTLGYLTDVSSNNLNFATAIGALATVSTSNTIALGRSNGTDTVQIPGALNVTGPITGTVSNSTSAVTATNALQLGGVAANQYVQTADARLSDARNPLPGSSNYIQNTTSQEPANFNVSGDGTVGETLNANLVNVTTQVSINGIKILSTPGGGGLNQGNLVAGQNAGSLYTSGGNNSYFGTGSALRQTAGDGNAYFGAGAGLNIRSGSGNSFFGDNSGISIVNNGDDNTLLGSLADGAQGISNATAVGQSAKVTQSNSLVLGSINGVNGATADTNVGIGTTAPAARLHVVGNGFFAGTITSTGNGVILGRLGIGTASPAANLDVAGTVRVQTLTSGFSQDVCVDAANTLSNCSSSIRYKENIRDFNGGLDLIRRFRPVAFDWKQNGSPDMGLVAEEVAAVDPLLVTHNGKGEVEGVKYNRLGVVLINAVKEQQAQIERQQKLIEDQQKQIDALRKLVSARLRPRRTLSKNSIK